MLTNGQKSAKFVSVSPKILSICKLINKRIYTLLVVLRQENRRSPRTAAHICKSILEIPGISEIFWYQTFQNFKKDRKKSQSRWLKKLKTCVEVSFLGQTNQAKKGPTKSDATVPLNWTFFVSFIMLVDF